MGTLNLMGTAEIALRLNLSKSRTHQLVNQKGFPDPAAVLVMGMVWETADVEAWIRANRPDLPEPQQ